MDSKTTGLWGAIAISMVVLVTFLSCLVAAFFLKDPTLMNLIVGAAIANATTTVGYWLGSSAGSAKKDDSIAALREKAP